MVTSGKWFQVVHTEPEELAMHKNYLSAIAKGEEKNRAEVDLCQIADLVVAVGPKLKDAISSQLRSSRREIFQLIPGSFTEFSDVEHAEQENVSFKVLAFGRGDFEDFSLKGYDIAAQSISSFQGFSLFRPRERREQPGNEVAGGAQSLEHAH